MSALGLSLTPELRAALLALYREVDQAVQAAGPVCQASGRCCRFKEWGHVLFLSHLEAALLLEGAPPHVGPVSRDFCPFQQEKLCTARDPRPLGCRIYFCDPHYQEKANAITEDALRRLKQLAEEQGVGWQYAPLHYFLNAVSAAGVEEKGTSPRLELPVVAAG